MAAAPTPIPALTELLLRAGDIPALPHVVFKILEASGFDEASLGELQRIIKADPGFALKVLKRANSGGRPQEAQVLSVNSAVSTIGSRAVVELASSAGARFDAFIGRSDPASLRKRGWWRRSLDTAVCCECIAMEVEELDREEAFTAGLLHCIGKTLMNQAEPEKMARVDALSLQGEDEFQAEHRLFGFDHGQVGAAAIRRWGLPDRLADAIDYHSEENTGSGRLRASVMLGVWVASETISGRAREAATRWALDYLGLQETALGPIQEKCREAIFKSEAMLFA